ncbi:hypothetical protein [Virgibacillus sp. DJP39]|uniref:hypothetical protein n=1 Tax=Virgibacillus sp. DJP39 TaxID=3409790 RepID=UPI003BB64EF1
MFEGRHLYDLKEKIINFNVFYKKMDRKKRKRIEEKMGKFQVKKIGDGNKIEIIIMNEFNDHLVRMLGSIENNHYYISELK